MSMQSSPSRNHVRNSQFHIPGQRLTKETECLAKETTSFDKKARLTKELRTAASHEKNCNVERSVSQKKLLELASHERLTKGIYLNSRLTKEIAVRSVSQEK